MSTPLDYEPRDAKRSHEHLRQHRRQRIEAASLVILTLVIGIMSIVPPLLLRTTADASRDGLALYGALALPVLFAGAMKGRIDGAALSFWVRLQIIVISTVFFVGLLSLGQCPHATYVGIGPIQFAVMGRPCNNVQPVEPFSWRLMRFLKSR